MFVRPLVVASCLAVLVLALGCEPPAVQVRHDLGAPVPLPEDLSAFNVTDFDVKGQPAADVGSYTTDALRSCLAQRWPIEPAGLPVGGTVTLTVDRTAGTRAVRRGDPTASGQPHTVELPSVAMTATVKVHFRLAWPGRAEPVICEMVRDYKSTEDPRVRGELGLGRPDDPERVPPAEQVVRELIDQCVESFCSMLKPLVIDKPVQLRDPGAFAGGGGAFEAVRQDNLHEAQRILARAVANNPGSAALQFNLGAVSEALNDLRTSLTHYDNAVKLSERKDPGYIEAADRVRQVLAVRNAKMP